MFLTVSKGLSGEYYLVLADDSGPIARIECSSYVDLDDCIRFGEQLSKAERIAFVYGESRHIE